MTSRTEVLEAAKRRWPDWRVDLIGPDNVGDFVLCLHYSPCIGSIEKPRWQTIEAPTLDALAAKIESR